MRYLIIVIMLLFISCGDEGCKEVATERNKTCDKMVVHYCNKHMYTPLQEHCEFEGKNYVCAHLEEDLVCEGEFSEEEFWNSYRLTLIEEMKDRNW